MKIENRNYKKEIKEHKDPFGIFGIIATILCVGLVISVLISEFSKKNTDEIVIETVSIQKYNELELRNKYLFIENQVKNQLLYDIAVEGEIDSVFVLSISNHIPTFLLNPDDESVKIDGLVDKQLMAFQLDSICADWYESIPFTIIDTEHDSTWVLNSDSYQSTMLIVNDIRNKWE